MIQCPKCSAIRVHEDSSSQCEVCGYSFFDERSDKKSFSTENSIPWENLEALGTFKALFQTIYHCLFKPSRIFCLISEKNSLFHAWLFGLAVGSIGILFDLLWQNGSTNFWNSLTEYGINTDFSNTSGRSLIYSPLTLSLHIFLLGLYVHFLLIITGGRHNTFRATIITACYTQSAAILSIIPFFNNIISLAWALCLLIFGTSCVHKISITRSCLTILLPLILLVIILSFIAIAAMSGGIILSSFLKDFLSIFR